MKPITYFHLCIYGVPSLCLFFFSPSLHCLPDVIAWSYWIPEDAAPKPAPPALLATCSHSPLPLLAHCDGEEAWSPGCMNLPLQFLPLSQSFTVKTSLLLLLSALPPFPSLHSPGFLILHISPRQPVYMRWD